MKTFTQWINEPDVDYDDLPVGKDAPRVPDPYDIAVGQRIRLLRERRNLSQVQVAAELGITHQQQQKNEAGANRIGASRLIQLMIVLKVKPDDVFAGIMPDGPMSDVLKLSPIEAAFALLPKKQQSAVLALVRTMAQANADDDK